MGHDFFNVCTEIDKKKGLRVRSPFDTDLLRSALAVQGMS